MDYSRNVTLFKRLAICTLCALALLGIYNDGSAQSRSYEILPAPDLWYNSVDGARVGVRVQGQTPGSFGDGPHRLNAGLWVGTKFPTHPVSYYVQFTEPINSMSDFGSEANISLESSFRTGFQQHGLSFNKRWQNGFDEQNYSELSFGFKGEDRFDDDYLLYTQLWQDNWLYLLSLNFDKTNEGALGRYIFHLNSEANIVGPDSEFLRGEFSFEQQIDLSKGFVVRGRIYTGLATSQTAPQYLFSRSLESPRSWMDRGLTRARGTIPPSWFALGNIQISGGPNLRGYLNQDVNALNNASAALFTSLSTVNMELDYPNPLDKAISDIPVFGGFIKLRSYLFLDSGTSLGVTEFEEPRTLSNAGLGFQFSINIPDYLGKNRGLAIRYDIPLWLSHPGDEKAFKYRNVFGIGAILSF